MQNVDPEISRLNTVRTISVSCVLGAAALCAWLYLTYVAPPPTAGENEAASSRQATEKMPAAPPTIRNEPPAGALPLLQRGSPAVPAVALPPIPVAPGSAVAGGRSGPPDFVIAAPLEAVHGASFVVTMSIAPRISAHAATFHLHYDVDALELIDIVDSSGTTLAAVPNGDGSVDLDIEDLGRAAQAPAATFLAHVIEPRTVAFTATVDLKDAAGQRLDATPIPPAFMMLVP